MADKKRNPKDDEEEVPDVPFHLRRDDESLPIEERLTPEEKHLLAETEENIEEGLCPWHGEKIKTETEKRTILTEDGKEKEITVRFRVCRCRVPNNPYFGNRVWEKT